MQFRTFLAKDMKAALANVRSEMGPEAVIVASERAKGGGVEHGSRFFQRSTCLHAPEVVGGIEEIRASGLIRDFFRARR